jgi:tRNA modification GTPase
VTPSGDTIVALASAPGAGARAVLRISGPDAGAVVARTCTAAGNATLPPAKRALISGSFHDGVGEQPLMLLWMPGPASYTREDVAELHLPGNPHLARVALDHLLAQGARHARRGEFTRRAFENGRMDLTRAEGVLALIHASNQAERRAATALLLGGLMDRLSVLRDNLEQLRSLAEASLDFDESDTGHVPEKLLLELAASTATGLEEALGWEEARAPAAVLPRVVLAGLPNAGKSSLFNRLVSGEQRAFVDDQAGSTRDVLAGPWSLPGGASVRLEDSAGRELASAGDVLAEGAQALAERAATSADLLLWVVDARTPATPPAQSPDCARLLLWNQTDRPGAAPEPPAEWLAWSKLWLPTSAETGTGLEALAQAAAELLGLAQVADSAETAPVVATAAELSARHRAALRSAQDDLTRATDEIHSGLPLDLVAETLRQATERLDDIQGSTTPEDLLDRIFASFCIGK